MNIKNLFSRALPMVGQAAGAYFGGPIGAEVGKNVGQMGSNAIEKKKTKSNTFFDSKSPSLSGFVGAGEEMSNPTKEVYREGFQPYESNMFNRRRGNDQNFDMQGLLKMIQMMKGGM